jgi:hypothetical protein
MKEGGAGGCVCAGWVIRACGCCVSEGRKGREGGLRVVLQIVVFPLQTPLQALSLSSSFSCSFLLRKKERQKCRRSSITSKRPTHTHIHPHQPPPLQKRTRSRRSSNTQPPPLDEDLTRRLLALIRDSEETMDPPPKDLFVDEKWDKVREGWPVARPSLTHQRRKRERKTPPPTPTAERRRQKTTPLFLRNLANKTTNNSSSTSPCAGQSTARWPARSSPPPSFVSF